LKLVSVPLLENLLKIEYNKMKNWKGNFGVDWINSARTLLTQF
jgi:hypothetical protein